MLTRDSSPTQASLTRSLRLFRTRERSRGAKGREKEDNMASVLEKDIGRSQRLIAIVVEILEGV
jgi:hypothetical protein